jgi:hypothetical protein
MSELGDPPCVLRDALLRSAPQDEGRSYLHVPVKKTLILRSARRARLEGRTIALQPFFS